MIRFSDAAWQRTETLREAIHRLPFNTELAAGSLSRDRSPSSPRRDAARISGNLIA